METLNPTAIAREILLESGGDIGRVEFHGDSMLPLLRDGDMLVVESVTWDQIGPGDIVVHRFDDKYPALRVMEKLPDKLFLKADNWPAPIFEAWRDDVLGRVTGLRREGVQTSCTARGWRRVARTAVLEYRLRGSAASVRRKVRSLAQRVRVDVAALRGGMVGMPEALQLNVSSVCNLECRMCPYLGVHQDDSVLSFMTSETFERLLPANQAHRGSGVQRLGRAFVQQEFVVLHRAYSRRMPHGANQPHHERNPPAPRRGHGARSVAARHAGDLDRRRHRPDRGVDPTQQRLRTHRRARRAAGRASSASVAPASRGSSRISWWATARIVSSPTSSVSPSGWVSRRSTSSRSSRPVTATSATISRSGVQRDAGRQLRYAIQIGQRLGVGIRLPTVSPNACLMPYHPHIAENGEIYPCCFLDYDGRQLFDGRQEVKLEPLSFGNAAAKDFRTLWNSREYMSFRRRNKKGDFPDGCRTASTSAPTPRTTWRTSSAPVHSARALSGPDRCRGRARGLSDRREALAAIVRGDLDAAAVSLATPRSMRTAS
jgi:hypothetical protein